MSPVLHAKCGEACLEQKIFRGFPDVLIPIGPPFAHALIPCLGTQGIRYSALLYMKTCFPANLIYKEMQYSQMVEASYLLGAPICSGFSHILWWFD